MTDESQKIFSPKRWCRFALLERPLTNALQKYCRFVGRHPIPFIIAPLLITCILSSGILLKFEIVRGLHYLYAPLHAQWKFEDRVFQESWANNDEQFYPGKDVFRRKSIYLIAVAKDGGSILRKPHTDEFINLLDWIINETFITVDGLIYTYRNICLHYRNQCFENTLARFVADIYRRSDQDQFNLTFPLFKSQLSTELTDLSQTLGGVHLDSKQRIETAKAWMILYQLQQNTKLSRKLSLDYENSLSKRIEENNVPVKLLNLFIFHSDIFEMELIKISSLISPKFIHTFFLLVLFSILCTFNVITISVSNESKSFITIDWLKSKPLLGFLGVIISFMAIISAIGFLLLINVPFTDIVTMMPFLSISKISHNTAVGIDDTFLILSAWHDTNSYQSTDERVGLSMQHAAVSIAITSITDIIAFLVGAIAPLPAVIYFCYYSAAAIAFTFLYYMSAFIAFLAIFGRLEEAYRNNLFYIKTIPSNQYMNASKLQKIFNMAELKSINSTSMQSPSKCGSKELVSCNTSLGYRQFIRNYYAPLLISRTVQVAAVILFIIYIIISIIGVQKLKIGLDVRNLLRENSSARNFLKLRQKFFNYKMPTIEIAVMKPPDMSQKTDRIKFFQILEEIENTACSGGRNTTEFWYLAYKRYIDELGFDDEVWEILQNDKKQFEQNLLPFLLANDKYRYDILSHDNGSVKAFRLSTEIIDIPTYSSQLIIQCANDIRNIAKRYEAEYNITTYSLLWQLADQLDVIWPQTLQDLCISALIIIPISLLIIPKPYCAILIALTVSSIALGTIGLMAFWDINLDATTMITIAMSIGFSADFAIHITYSYTTCHSNSIPHEQLSKTLEMVGWPILQASVSVLLGILPLATVNLYIVQACFKTVMLIIIIGMIHALLFLPLLLVQVHTLYLWLQLQRRMEWKKKFYAIFSS